MIEVTYVFTPISERYISRAIYTLYKYSKPDSFRIVLVDQVKGRMSQKTWDYLKDKVHLYLHPPTRQLGYAKAQNEGILHALHWKTPYICASNDDLEIIDSRWMDGIKETFAKNERIGCVVPMSPRVAGWGYGVKHNPEVLPYKEEYTKEDYDYLLKGDFSDKKAQLPASYPTNISGTIVDGAVFVMPYFKRECLLDVGLMDEHFFPGCFLPDEQVLMGNLKYKSIKDIKKGDWVVGKTGKRNPVNKVIKKPFRGKILELSFVGTTEKVRLTPDHKVFTRSKTGEKGKRSVSWSRNKNEIRETEAKNLLPRDLVFCPQPTFTKFNSGKEDKELFRIYGYFLAEGSYIKKATKKGKKKYGLTFSFNINEKQYIREVYKYFKDNGYSVSIYERPKKTITTVEVYSKELAEEFAFLFGEYSWGKYISDKVMVQDQELLRELVIGYSNGDGGICSEFKNGKSKKVYRQLRMKSVSKQLIVDIKNILLRLGIPSLLYVKTEVKQRSRRPVHELYISQNYLNRLYGLPDDREDWQKAPRNEVFEQNGKIFYPIKEIREIDYEGDVYDLNVEIDHSYVVGPMAVHNSGEDVDWNARAYIKGWRVVSTSLSWIWHHWSSSKDLFASGELEDPYYKPPDHPYWVNLGELWRPEDNEGHDFDVWGHYRNQKGEKVPLKRVEEVFVDKV